MFTSVLTVWLRAPYYALINVMVASPVGQRFKYHILLDHVLYAAHLLNTSTHGIGSDYVFPGL